MQAWEAGATGSASCLVTEDKTALAAGSGDLRVYATPWMLALMEQAAMACAAPFLEEGETTVGTLADIRHLAASPVGQTVTAEAELMEAEGRRLVFRVTARDAAGPIGEGTHERYVVAAERFQNKAEARK